MSDADSTLHSEREWFGSTILKICYSES